MNIEQLVSNLLISTKFYPPETRSELVARPRLTSQLSQGLSRSLTLISAPAGFGKTTLVADWISQSNINPSRPIELTWLSLDSDDNDPNRFAIYVLSALSTVEPDLKSLVITLLNTPQTGTIKPVIQATINRLAQVKDQGRKIVLALDDYHVIESKPVHELLVYLLDHIPSCLRLLILSRSDPPLPLARLRARGQLTEIRANDLRFKPDEANIFLKDVMQIDLKPQDIQTLDRRTEGWIAGLQLAAFSMQGRQDVSDFVESFAGSHHFILDYLIEEVLVQQPENIQEFLLKTSILDQFCEPLCDAVIGTSRSADLLHQLYKLNLFLIPLDDQRYWFRWHHLFADMLRHQLKRQYPEIISELHHRASQWYAHENFIDLAFQHAIKAENFEQATRLIVAHWRQMTQTGQINMVQQWLNQLPDSILSTDPVVCVVVAWTKWIMWQTDEVESWLERAEVSHHQEAGSSFTDTLEYKSVPVQIACLRAYVANRQGDPHQALNYAQEALHIAPKSDHAVVGNAHYSLASTYRELSETRKSADHYALALPLLRSVDNYLGETGAVFHLSRLHQALGELQKAAYYCREAINDYQRRGLDHLPLLGLVHLTLAEILYEWNEITEANKHLQYGIEMSQYGGHLESPILYVLVLMRLNRVQDYSDEISEALQSVNEMLSRLRDLPFTYPQLMSAQVRMWVDQGNLSEAIAWADNEAKHPSSHYISMQEICAISVAYVRLAERRFEDTIQFLNPWIQLAKSSNRIGRIIEMHLLRTRAFLGNGDMETALFELVAALKLAEPEGYIRTFVDQGDDIARLLRNLDVQDIRLRAYIDKLLDVFTVSTDNKRNSEITHELLDPLSEREREVLRLMATGLSNREIAERLFVAVGTIKTHVHRICDKLGVRNRTEAAARARELKLL